MMIKTRDHSKDPVPPNVVQTNMATDDMITQQRAAPTRVMTLKEMMQATLKATQHFRRVIEQETDALNSFDYRQAGALHDAKKQAATDYADAIEMISKQAGLLKTVPQAAKDIFAKEREVFHEAIQANKSALEKAAILSKRLSSRIIGIAKNHMAENSINYSPYGTAMAQNKKAVYLSFNETL